MNKKKLSRTLAIFFLVQSILLLQELSAETYVLNPPTKVNLKESNIYFEKKYEVAHLGLFIYRLDVLKKYPKETIKRMYRDAFTDRARLLFDLEHIDIVKKGWTRYYPFTLDGKDFIIRIFRTEELPYRPKARVLFEGIIENPAVTFQILPGINSILADCKIKPHEIQLVSSADTSP